jgi:hypothetical protein
MSGGRLWGILPWSPWLTVLHGTRCSRNGLWMMRLDACADCVGRDRCVLRMVRRRVPNVEFGITASGAPGPCVSLSCNESYEKPQISRHGRRLVKQVASARTRDSRDEVAQGTLELWHLRG